MIDLFAGAGGLSVTAAILVTAAFCSLVRGLPAIIWTLRCPRDARHYRCPRMDRRSALSGLLKGRSG